jgi:hypothetical protein
MDNPGAIFTVLALLVGLLATAGYGLMSVAQRKGARVAFCATAFFFAAIGVELGLVMAWPLPAKIIVAGCFGFAAAGALVYAFHSVSLLENSDHSETGRLVSQAQFAKVAELESFLGGKNENDLRQLFDLDAILQNNIAVQAKRFGMALTGHYAEFKYKNPMIFWAKEGHYSVGPNGVNVSNGVEDVLFIEITPKYEASTKKLTEYLNSALVPGSIKKPVKEFQDAINQYNEKILHVLDAWAHEDANYFFQNMNMGSRYYGVIQSDLAKQVSPLEKPADRVLSAIAETWKISK